MRYEAIVIGVSAGGLNAMKKLFTALPATFSCPVVIVQHISAHSDSMWIDLMDKISQIPVKEADEKENILPGRIYMAPPNYHLLIEKDHTFSLTVDERINFARPSIDVLFESAAEAYKDKLIGIVLTGSNNDGANGVKKIKKLGGLVIVQDPGDAESPDMPLSAITACQPDLILSMDRIVHFLTELHSEYTKH